MCRPLHVLHARGIGLIMWRLGRYAHAPMGDHDGNTNGAYLFTSIAHRAPWDTWQLPSCPELGGGNWIHGTHGGSGATMCQRRELTPWHAWQHPSCPEPGLRSWAHGTHGGTQAALSQEARAGAPGGVAAHELPVSGGITRCHGHVGVCEHTSCPSS
jgi:hypothetical protein